MFNSYSSQEIRYAKRIPVSTPRLKKLLMQHVKISRQQLVATMKSANVEQLNIQKYVLQDGDIAWQANFADEENKANASRCSAAAKHAERLRRDTYDGEWGCVRSGWRKIRSTNGMKERISARALAGHRKRERSGSRRVGQALLANQLEVRGGVQRQQKRIKYQRRTAGIEMVR